MTHRTSARTRATFTCIASVSAAALTVSSPARAGDETFFERYTPELVPAIELGSDIASAYSGLASALSMAKTLGGWLGLPFGQEPSLEQQMNTQFAAVLQQLSAIEMGVHAASGLNTEQHIAQLRGNAVAASMQARNFVIANNAAMSESTAQAVLLQSLSSIQTMTDDSFFQRVHFSFDNDGADTNTGGVITRAEWKQVIDPPVAVNGRMHEWRFGIPALSQMTAARLSVLASVFPDFAQTTRFDGELTALRDRFNTLRARSEGFIKCGQSVWAMPGSSGTFLLKVICADTATGITASVERQARIAPAQYTNDWGMLNCTCPSPQHAANCQHPTGPEQCGAKVCTTPTRYIPGSSCFSPGRWPTTARNLNGSTSPLAGLFSRQKSATAGFTSILANGENDAKSLLGTKMGLFEQRKLSDQLSAIILGKKGAAALGVLRSRQTNRCADFMPGLLEGSGVNIIPGMPFQLGTCGSPLTESSQGWVWDERNNRFFNFPEGWLTGDMWCIEAESSRTGSPVRVAECDGSEGQRWTYDPVSERLRNGLGKTLEMRSGVLASMQPDSSLTAQKWISD